MYLFIILNKFYVIIRVREGKFPRFLFADESEARGGQKCRIILYIGVQDAVT